ncbi:MAG: fatty acid desaturase [Deltaproteobacteria bacterium]|nr:fatty acid desaturase [Deltaproteobacteria bacterium]
MNKLVFILIHLGCLLAIWSGVSTVAVLFCLAFYLIRMFAITAGYHRLFSHRSYETSRVFQFILGFIGAASVQRGPLWWAANHRHHHRHSDTEEDIHSPGIRGVWWAHAGWVLSPEDRSDLKVVKDLSIYPELRWLERYHYVPPLLLLGGTFLLGLLLNAVFPALHTSGLQMMVWGALVSTVILYHCTFAINSLAHIIGRKRFETGDESRNSLFLALITLGEGWHNNHHRYPGSERQGFYWWEIDITHYILKALAVLGIVWDLREPPARIYEEARTTGT